ncbi:MAG: type II secretion system protein [Verrucomicrobiae bacterium]|nr:type II secretion system protein [Verrucomicrobiae bacterium]
MKKSNPIAGRRRASRGFTMVEMLIVISVIAIMAALVISAFSNAAQDTRRVVARQQQAAVQSAVNAWVTAKASGTGSLSGARTEYNAATTSLARLNLVANYLDEKTIAHFRTNTTNTGQVLSEALKKTNQYLELPAWNAASYPKVELK